MAAPTLALDLPSGLDATTGGAGDPTIEAVATMTLALPKEGLRAEGTDQFVGELYLADIGVPRLLYTRPPLNLEAPDVFAASDRVRLN
jgi:NAD(P)H-hydrate epimerase